jgi:peptidyl-prolyl cis-trans isomerase C
MKVRKTGFSVSCLVAVGFVLPMFSANAKELAKVNNQAITSRDLELALGTLNEGQRQTFLRDANSRREVLLTVIDREVLAQEGEKLRLDQDPGFKEAMAAFRKQLLMSEVLEKKLAPQLNQSAVKKYYSTHRDIFSTDQVHVQHILVTDEAEAKRLVALAREPKSDFQDLAEKYSKDPSAKNNRGDIGFIGRDRMVPAFTDAAFSGAQNDIIGPVHTAYGYHVIRVVEKKTGKPLEFDEVELRVKDLLRQQLVRNYVDSLKQQAKITVDNKALEKL